MKRKLLILAALLLPCARGFCAGLKIEEYASPLSGVRTVRVAAERVNVTLSAAGTLAQADAGLAALGMRRDIWMEKLAFIRVVLPENMKVADGIAALSTQPWVAAAEPDRIYNKSAVPNDPYFNAQPGLAAISAAAGWEYQTGSTDTIIAILDTGIAASHPDIAGRVSAGSNIRFDVLNDNTQYAENPPTDCEGHGSHVAGIAAADTNNNTGVAGVAWNGEVVSVRLFQSNFQNCQSTPNSAIAAGLQYVADLAQNTGRRAVVNMSLGDTPSSLTDPCSITLRNAVDYALARNVVIVAAAGNYLTPDSVVGKAVMCPARIPGVIAVGALDPSGIVCDFSARGAQLGVTAPGDYITSLNAEGGYVQMSGTSMAAPFVTGLAALLLAARPAASTAAITNWLETGADPAGAPFSLDYGYGRLNNYKTLRLAVTGTKTDSHAEGKATAFPNPFRPARGQMLTFLVPDSINGAEPKIKIYNINGELIKTLYTMSWDGTNESGNPVASGVYVFRVETSGGKTNGRVAIIR
ncbi:MAG: S8 family serine peptidase [Elusimicrobiaceae bacterium]|nr:S8 family serine peptidase [Elusimicrobiaceae bacterium]